MKKLEDMNLVDDFLAYSLTAHKTYGEKASRYILVYSAAQNRASYSSAAEGLVWGRAGKPWGAA